MLAKNPQWAELVNAGRFEVEKALLSQKITSVDFNNLKPRNIQDAFAMETPTFATIKKYQGVAKMNACIEKLLYWLADGVSLTDKNISEAQLEILREFIEEDYSYLTLAELKLCFKNGLKGKYGKIFGRLDTEVVMEWVNMFVEEKFEYAAKLSVERSNEEKDGKKNPPSEFILSANKRLREKLERDSMKNFVENKVQLTYRHFDTLEKYCNEYDLNHAEFLKDMQRAWKEEYQSNIQNESVSFDVFCAFKSSEFLVLENKKFTDNQEKQAI